MKNRKNIDVIDKVDEEKSSRKMSRGPKSGNTSMVDDSFRRDEGQTLEEFSEKKEERRKEEELWIESVKSDDVRFIDALLAFMNVSDVKKYVVKDVYDHQARQKLTNRQIIKSRYCLPLENLMELSQDNALADVKSDHLNVSQVMSELNGNLRGEEASEDSFLTVVPNRSSSVDKKKNRTKREKQGSSINQNVKQAK